MVEAAPHGWNQVLPFLATLHFCLGLKNGQKPKALFLFAHNVKYKEKKYKFKKWAQNPFKSGKHLKPKAIPSFLEDVGPKWQN